MSAESPGRSKGKPKIALIAAGIAMAAGLAGVVFVLSRPAPRGAADRLAGAVAGSAVGQAVVESLSEAERADYLARSMEVKDLEIGQDSFVDSEGKTKEVPGLLRVTGVVVNKGDKSVAELTLELQPLGEGDRPLGVYNEDLIGKKPLLPNSERKFRFTIPAKSEMTGKARHKLK